ncbi:MAG: hypothetical protein AAGF45_00580 [Pseudomonadota bacterium]
MSQNPRIVCLRDQVRDGESALSLMRLLKSLNPHENVETLFYLRIPRFFPLIRSDSYLSFVDLERTRRQTMQPKTWLLLDLSGEGYAYDPRFATRIDRWAEETGIDPQRMIFLQTNAKFAEDLAHCPTASGRSKRLKFARYHHYAHVLLERAKHYDWPALGHHNIEASLSGRKMALCLNATPKGHRSLLAFLLFEKQLRQHFHLTFRTAANRKIDEEQMRRSVAPFAAHFDLSVDEIFDRLEREKFDESDLDGQQVHDLVYALEDKLYRKTVASVVTESEMAPPNRIRWTEKSLKPLLMGHPMVVFGNQGSLAALENLGFDVLRDVVDPAYDTIIDPFRRFRGAFSSMVSLIGGDRQIFREPSIKARLHANADMFDGRLLSAMEQQTLGDLKHAFDAAP